MDTAEVFWSILEAGLCLLAVNLPSLWFYRHNLSPESMLASIRSAISLRSLRSNHSGALPSRKDNQSAHSASSQTKFASAETSEAYAMRDVEALDEVTALPGTIIVSSRIEQEETIVWEAEERRTAKSWNQVSCRAERDGTSEHILAQSRYPQKDSLDH